MSWSLVSLSVRIAFFCNSNSSRARDSCCSFSWVILKYSDWHFSCAKSNTTLDPHKSSAFPKYFYRNYIFHLICTAALWGRQYHHLSSHALIYGNKTLCFSQCGLASLCHNYYWYKKSYSSNLTTSTIFPLFKMLWKTLLNVKSHTIAATSSLHSRVSFFKL